MWTWDQSAGTLSRGGKVVARGYAGSGRGKNNPALQGVRGIGPVPRGRWLIGRPYNSGATGPYTLVITAQDGVLDDVHGPTGRGAFRIHGDSIARPGTASRGCIILPRTTREMIWKSGDRELEVVE